MRIAICDDSREDLDTLQPMLRAALAYASVEAELCVYRDGKAMLAALNAGETWALCFLDIYMPDVGGVQLAEAIRAENRETVIVFTTSSPGHMADAYRLGAVHYLLKPFAQSDVDEALARALRMAGQAQRTIELVVDRVLRPVLLSDILYVESQNHAILLHTVGGPLRCYTSLDDIQAMLKDSPFIRCHRGFLVNPAYISEVQDEDFKMEDGKLAPIRREGRAAIKQMYYDYCIRHARGRD